MIEMIRCGDGPSIDSLDFSTIPVFASEDRVWWEPTDWLVSQYESGTKATSIRTYAGHLLDLLRQMEIDGKDLNDLDHAYMAAYLAALEATAPKAAQQFLRTQLSFLRWLELNGALRGVIGVGSLYKIALNEDFTWRPLRHRLKHIPDQDAPSDDAIEVTMASLVTQDDALRKRDELAMQWQASAGLRAKEVCGMEINDLPSRMLIDKCVHRGRPLRVRITHGKGGISRHVSVSSTLASLTRDWLDHGRPAIVAMANKRTGVSENHEEGALFLSRNGGHLRPQTLSNKVRAAFLTAVSAGDLALDERVWSHGLRHRFGTNDYRLRDEAGQPRAAFHTQRQLGHKKLSSTDTYVHRTEVDSAGAVPPLRRT
jgi:integrase/recombinase XerD